MSCHNAARAARDYVFAMHCDCNLLPRTLVTFDKRRLASAQKFRLYARTVCIVSDLTLFKRLSRLSRASKRVCKQL